MSNDDWSKYVNGEIATTNQNNSTLNSAQKQFGESALVFLLSRAVNYCEKRGEKGLKGGINKEDAKILRNAIDVFDQVVKFGFAFLEW